MKVTKAPPEITEEGLLRRLGKPKDNRDIYDVIDELKIFFGVTACRYNQLRQALIDAGVLVPDEEDFKK